MTNKQINILHLYPNDMNIYGDQGNVLVLQKRLKRRGFNVNIIKYNQGDIFPDDVDIIVGGGGQDSGQSKIYDDLQKIAPKLRKLADNDTPMLLICGLYQLFGHKFIAKDGKEMPGIGILDVTTIGSDERLIGNIITHSTKFGDLIGYENHSGQTTIRDNSTPLGIVIKGVGNNTKDATEGACYRNVIGTYMHGAFLPKNPKVADWIIKKAISKKYDSSALTVLDDNIAKQARIIAKKRPR